MSIPKELLDLINLSLTDGVITAREYNVLLKKASDLGLDPDEAMLIIDSYRQKAEQTMTQNELDRIGATCPKCFHPILDLTTVCPHCKEKITAQATKEVKEIIDKLETALQAYKTSGTIKNKAVVERVIRKAKTYYASNPKVCSLVQEIEEEAKQAAIPGLIKELKKAQADFKKTPQFSSKSAEAHLDSLVYAAEAVYGTMPDVNLLVKTIKEDMRKHAKVSRRFVTIPVYSIIIFIIVTVVLSLL